MCMTEENKETITPKMVKLTTLIIVMSVMAVALILVWFYKFTPQQ